MRFLYSVLALFVAVTAGCSLDSRSPAPSDGGARPRAAMQAPSLATTEWGFDPLNASTCASDNNSCTPTCAGTGVGPCRSLSQIYARWGTAGPQLPQVTTIDLLSDDTVSDPFLVDPLLPDTVSSGGALVVNGSLVQVGTATIGTFTQRNRASGTPNTITANGQSGAFWTPFVNRLVHDTTANAWFWVQSDVGSATAIISEPMQSAVGASATPPPYQTIANGDALVIVRDTDLYVPRINSTRGFGALFGGSPFSGVTFNHVNFIGTLVTNDIESTANECSINPTLVALANRTWALANSNAIASLQGIVNAWGGIIGGTPSFSRAPNNASLLDGDVIISGHFHETQGGVMQLGRVYMAAGAQLKDDTQPGTFFLTPGNYGDAELWGTGNFDIANGSKMLIKGTVATELLLLPTIQGQTTARPFTAGSFGAPVNITASNIASNGSLQDPASQSIIQVQTTN